MILGLGVERLIVEIPRERLHLFFVLEQIDLHHLAHFLLYAGIDVHAVHSSLVSFDFGLCCCEVSFADIRLGFFDQLGGFDSEKILFDCFAGLADHRRIRDQFESQHCVFRKDLALDRTTDLGLDEHCFLCFARQTLDFRNEYEVAFGVGGKASDVDRQGNIRSWSEFGSESFGHGDSFAQSEFDFEVLGQTRLQSSQTGDEAILDLAKRDDVVKLSLLSV